ncbi:cytochrome b/b6 domain-containing protein [Paeniglutamicibacter sp. Y32M11]|uniref:cytochrome b/b6 domain-containing protein n=1 Tax=Paeniglutamicibacter sp. Y32M11 TaxID=2853258 RepID=UPI001C528892|nr:cytochrome b/b6 domain-containing protein [Paeniglutamicibacter sp. Y32M11]QXQ10022.1 cytochrome b/b6 domain-containing protein [Paeniglutamicibacter sp. Y32M11]
MSLLTTTQEPPPKSKSKWVGTAARIFIAVVVLAVVILVAMWARGLGPVQEFLAQYPGHSELPHNAPVGIPAWLGWQHFLNAFFIVLIIRSGWQVRTTARPKAYWTRKNTGIFKTRSKPSKISLELWFHLSMDMLWLLNGLIFIVMLFVSGGWMRIVPTSWDVFPNALSAALQYASLNWPVENGWVNYNALQVLAYFTIVFIAAPLAAITGVRMSPAWPKGNAALDKIYPMEAARKIHFPVMIFFTAFVIMHVALVLCTGALKNLNHMFASREDAGWLGFGIFALSVAVMVGSYFLAKPIFLRPIAGLMGKISK